ncbi:MAG TPA: GNAT family N-acetyltransferase [Kofleriaceae bacterium]|jgi:ribosomal protein S18 acetylase RimI-like enzyme
MTVTVRHARPSDAAALVAHLKALATEPSIDIPLAPDEITLTPEDERELIEAQKGSTRSAMLVAIDGDALAGELTIKAISSRRAVAHVATLGMSVAASHRRRGIGEALLRAAIEWADANDFLRVELYVYARNAAAIALYQKLGFSIEGKRAAFIREGDAFLDDFVMARLTGPARGT